MSRKENDGRIRDPLEEGEDQSNRTSTSGNREESMTESGKDAFGRKSAVRNPDSTSEQEEEQTPRSSGTESLGGETRGEEDRKGPGGVEGTE